MKSDNNTVSWVCSGFTTLTGIASTSQVMQVILLILGILSALVSLSYNIFVWYNKAKADKVITSKEIEEALKIVKDGINNVKDNIKKEDK